MAGRRAAAGLVFAAVALTATGCLGAGGKTVTVAATQAVTTTQTVTTTGSVISARPCAGTQLAASFALVPNSAGAGQIAYILTVRNTSRSACSVHGVPAGTLLGANGTALRTHVKAAGGGHARIVLPPGASATALAGFSPDMAGAGDSQSGMCQPRAYTFQLSAKGGAVTEAAIKPPTSVCEQGTLRFEAFGYAS